MSLPKKHREETEKLIREQSKTNSDKIKFAHWILNEGFYPEPFVLPPCFKISDFNLSSDRHESKSYDASNWKSYELANISFPKTGLIQRVFSIMHPKRFHDIVWELTTNWEDLLDKLFDPDNEIYSYSFPISITQNNQGKLRSGRMVYEFLEMAEKDLVAEAHNYNKIAKVDITNFYNSVYTHTIAWSWIGDRKKALSDSGVFNFVGTKLDKLFQYSNDQRTNGLAVGPVISDLIVELILSERDKEISKKIRELGIDFLATRFKDDYKILTNSKEEGEKIVKIIIDVLGEFNLQVNEAKTQILDLPEGLYRPHAIKYEPNSLRKNDESKIDFKTFEYTLLKSLEIHREHLGTSILEKFLSELINKNKQLPVYQRLKISFPNENIPTDRPNYEKVRRKNIQKAISLLFMLKNESPKSMGKVLSIIECIILDPSNHWLKDNDLLIDLFLAEMEKAILKSSSFELLWLLYFSRRHQIDVDLIRLIKTLKKQGKIQQTQSQLEILKNPFIATLRNKMPTIGEWSNPFGDNEININMFTSPENLKDTYLIDYLDIFDRGEPEN